MQQVWNKKKETSSSTRPAQSLKIQTHRNENTRAIYKWCTLCKTSPAELERERERERTAAAHDLDVTNPIVVQSLPI
jgi:hypothetical protein